MYKKFIKWIFMIIALSILLSGCNYKETDVNVTDQNTSEPLTETPSDTDDHNMESPGQSAGASDPTPTPPSSTAAATETISGETGTPATETQKTASPKPTSALKTSAPKTSTSKPTSPEKPTSTAAPSSTELPTPKPFDKNLFNQNKNNEYTSYQQVNNISSGISWPEGQALPVFASPAATLDTISVTALTNDEQITFSAFQGIVNKKQPRVYLLDNNPDEGSTTWAATFKFKRTSYSSSTKYNLIKKYASEIKGVVLYDASKSPHYRNLAGTVAGVKGAIPVTPDVYSRLKANGINLTVVEDLTSLNYTTAIDIYNYMYDNYWKLCEKRLIVSADPSEDLSHTRDIAAATGTAVVYLDCKTSSEKTVFEKYLKDMKAGEALVLGWFTTERSGIGTATSYGIGTVPANFYISGTVYGGTDHKIQIQEVPDKPELTNKVYIAVYISDGDNIQYNQRYMRKLWDQSKNDRGKVPINWTISPALVDIGPGLMNYYYTTATDKDCFVAGPSGLGYALLYNTTWETGATPGDKLTNGEYMAGYVKLTETYLQRSGLRVVTIWDNATDMQRKAYEAGSRYLYGATVQKFGNFGTVNSSIENNRIAFDKHVICYAGEYNELYSSMKNQISSWDRKSPLFLSYQISVWGNVKPAEINRLYDQLNSEFPGKVEFVRADHYFALYNEAIGIPFNICMSSKVKVTASDNQTKAACAIDGTPVSMWSTSKSGEKWLRFDLGKTYEISRYVIRHAEDGGEHKYLNTRNYRVQVSTNGTTWTTVDTYKENQAAVTDVNISPVRARYVRIYIDDPGVDGTARIADVEIYGK